MPEIGQISDERALQGDIYTKTPALVSGTGVVWRKEYGPDDMTVDPVTGKVTWNIPAGLPGESFHIGVKAANTDGVDIETWVLTVGNGNIVYVGPAESHNTIASGMAAMQSGDTLIVRDGVLASVNNENRIPGGSIRAQQPPAGTSSKFTTVMAENPGKTILDGEGKKDVLIDLVGSYTPPDWANDIGATTSRNYIAIKGFIVKNATSHGVRTQFVHHVKLIDIGVVDSGRAATTSAAANVPNVYIRRSDYMLVEGLYSWGHSRYRFQFKDSAYGVVRRSIGRIDEYRGDQPIGGFVSYCSKNIVYQNNMVIDGNHREFWLNFENMANIYGVPATGCASYPEGNVFERSIGINTHLGLMLTMATDNINPTVWKDMIGWDIYLDRYSAGTADITRMLHGAGASLTDQSTLGYINATPGFAAAGGRAFFYSRSQPSDVKNSIIYNFGWNGAQTADQGPLAWSMDLSGRMALSYNNIYGFKGSLTGGGGSESVTNTITSAPGLKYLTRLESGSSLETAGEGGKRIGAKVLTFIGKSGTFYGENGYDSETNISMWPFPHEDIIREKMRDYSYTGLTRDGTVQTLSGNRGFCADGKGLYGGPITLTSYIWEYLGNPCPSSICGSEFDNIKPAAPEGLIVR